jgi:hypothetical protein
MPDHHAFAQGRTDRRLSYIKAKELGFAIKWWGGGGGVAYLWNFEVPYLSSVLRIRIHRIHMFLGLPDPDPIVRGMDPDPALDRDPSIIMQKY